MGAFESFHIEPNNSEDKDFLHINSNRGKVKINSSLAGFRFKDKDTNQFIFYIPSLEITGYGETIEDATQMAKFSLDDLFEAFSKMSRKALYNELNSLGWKKGLFNKDFSKSYIDGMGELKNFNVELDKVEKLTLTAA